MLFTPSRFQASHLQPRFARLNIQERDFHDPRTHSMDSVGANAFDEYGKALAANPEMTAFMEQSSLDISAKRVTKDEQPENDSLQFFISKAYDTESRPPVLQVLLNKNPFYDWTVDRMHSALSWLMLKVMVEDAADKKDTASNQAPPTLFLPDGTKIEPTVSDPNQTNPD